MKKYILIALSILSFASNADAHSCSDSQLERGCWETVNSQGAPQCHCRKSAVENSEASENLVVVRVSSGQVLGTLDEMLSAAKSEGSREIGSCSARNCEWIGFCYCGGAGGRR